MGTSREEISRETSPGQAGSGIGAEAAILHVDMDSFYAAVEQLDDPALAGRPVVVGGGGPRGVVASCSYEARAFGVRSAMPSVQARRLCPMAVLVAPRFDRYREISRRLRQILVSYTSLVEPLGLDEAYLDVAGARRLLGTPRAIAGAIRSRVRDELSLGCSIGVGRTKLVAKLASRAAKPVGLRTGVSSGRGVIVVAPEEESAFLWPMPIEALPGVGPATARRLRDLGILTVRELASLPPSAAVRCLGATHGRRVVLLAHGVDPRPVVPERPARSIGHEETFDEDLNGLAALRPHVLRMSEAVGARLSARGLGARTVTIKVRFDDFSAVTRSRTSVSPVGDGGSIGEIASSLLTELELAAAVRLLGVGAANLASRPSVRQLSFTEGMVPSSGTAGTEFSGGDGALAGGDWRWCEVERAIDAVRSRFGARTLRRGGLAPSSRLDPGA